MSDRFIAPIKEKPANCEYHLSDYVKTRSMAFSIINYRFKDFEEYKAYKLAKKLNAT